MPASFSHDTRPRSWAVKRAARRYEARWIDADGKTRAAKGSRDAAGTFVPFTTKTAAKAYAVEQVARLEAEPERSGQGRPATLDALIDLFLERYERVNARGKTPDPATVAKLTKQLVRARAAFGHRIPSELAREELEDWRADLPAGSQHDYFRALRQMLSWAHARNHINRDPTVGILNPKRPKTEREEIHPFESWEEIAAVGAELGPVYGALVVFWGNTGLRPEEAWALHRSDVEYFDGPFTPGDGLPRGVLRVHQRYAWNGNGRKVKPGTKTGEPERWVPFGERAERALRSLPPRIDTPILFPTPRGHYIDADAFRNREWLPALRAAGLERRRTYDLRHTYASLKLQENTPPAKLVLMMGTSLEQLQKTYSRWLTSDNQWGGDAPVRRAVGE